jgi:hypothetical protein
MTDKKLTPEQKIAAILRDNITFSPQTGDYVIHGAIEKLLEQEKINSVSFINWAMDNDFSCKKNPEGGYLWYYFDNEEQVFTPEQLYDIYNNQQP